MSSSPDPYMSPPGGIPPYGQQNPAGAPPPYGQQNPAGAPPPYGQQNPPPYGPNGYSENMGPSPYGPGGYQGSPVGSSPYGPPPYQNGQPGRYGNMPPNMMGMRNARAQRAMVYGFISLGLSLFTLFNVFGYAGLVTGIFSIIYGVQGSRIANNLPNKAGKSQAITGIVLGSIAVGLVLLTFMLRMVVESSSYN